MLLGNEPWIGNAITGATALLASYIGAFTSALQTRLQLRLESRKRDDMLAERKFTTYNKVIQADGAHNVGLIHFNSEYIEHLDIKLYKDKIRPHLFEELHVLDEDVRKKTRELDKKLSEIDFLDKVGDWPDKESGQALQLYTELIDLIEKHYK